MKKTILILGVVLGLASAGTLAAADDGKLGEALAYASERKSAYVDELIALTKIPSISTLREHEQDMRRAASWVKDRCERAGLGVEIMETGAQPIGVRGAPERLWIRRRFASHQASLPAQQRSSVTDHGCVG